MQVVGGMILQAVETQQKKPCQTLIGAYLRSEKMRNDVVDIFLECHGDNDNTYGVNSRYQ